MAAQHALYPDCPTIIRTVEVGGLTKAQLREQFRQHGISLNAQGERLMTEVPFTRSESPCRLETVELTVRQLGFPEGATSAEIFARAGELGLELCPLEVGPYLRLQYLDQPQGFWITIASQKPAEPADVPSGFYLRRLEDGLWLRGYTASPDHLWDADDHFIFCKPHG